MTWLAPLSVIARAILEALFNGLWQGIAVSMAAACLIRLCRRPNAATRYAGWWLALVTIAALPLTELGVRFSTPLAPGRVVGAFDAYFSPSDARRPDAGHPSTLIASVPNLPIAVETITASAVGDATNMPAAKSIESRLLPKLPVTTFHVRDRWALVLFAMWLLGAACMLARPLWSITHIARIRRRAVPLSAEHQARLEAWLRVSGGSRRVRLCEAAGVPTPMSVGLLNPLIVIPGELASQLSPAEFDHLLLHELAHVRRKDNWTHLIQKLVEAVLFFHPAVWWIGRKLELERESACDDWAVSMTGQARPYAASLAKLVEVSAPLREPMLATGVFRRARQISVRIERLLDRRRNANARISRSLILAIVVVLVSITAISSQTGAVLARPATQVTEHPAITAAPAGEDQDDVQVQELVDRIQQLKEQLRQAENMVRKARKVTPRADKQVQAAEKYLEQFQAQIPQIEEELQALSEQPEILTPQARLETQALGQQMAALDARNDLNILLNRNQALLGSQLNQAEQQLRELMQRDQMQNRAMTENLVELHNLAEAKKLAETSALLAQTEKFDRSSTEFNYQQFNGIWTGLNFRTKGQIEFAEDDSGVKSVSPGGSLTIEERKGWTTRKYEVTAAERRYWVNGAPKPLDNEARAWIAEVLPQIIRESAVGADARVKRILKQHGPNGVLDEIGKIGSDHAKRIYFAELFSNEPLPADALQRASRQIGRDMASDGEKGRLLIDIFPAFLKESSGRAEFFHAVNTMASDGEHRRVLFAVLEKDGASKDTLVPVLNSAARMASDGEKGRVLSLAADAPAFNDSVSADFQHAVNTMASDGEHARVLMALMRKDKLGRDTLVMILKSAGRMASDGEKGRVLIRASEFYTNEPGVRSAFFNAAAAMASDGEHSHVLTALLGKSGLDKETFMEVAHSAARMASDGEKGRVLRQVAVMCPGDDAMIDALLQAVSTIASDSEYRRVMSAMTSRGDVSGKIGKIRHI